MDNLEKRMVSGIVFTLLLIGMLTLTFNIQPAKSEWTGTVYIRADGSIDPPDAPITTLNNVTYTLTDDITSFDVGIVVEKDSIVIDGVGYTVQGRPSYPSSGIYLSGRSDVTIKNLTIKKFFEGIYLNCSSNNCIYGNNITNNFNGVSFYISCKNNTIYENNITNNYYGICLQGTLYYIQRPENNRFYGNNIINNRDAGVLLDGCLNNIFYHNNFINNTPQIKVTHRQQTNIWDNGYPSGGNYWSNYTDIDKNGDGIGDTPYVIDEANKDNYPLMSPWSPKTPVEVPFWMQWWLWAIVAVVIIALAGAVYFLKKRKPPTPTAPTSATEDA